MSVLIRVIPGVADVFIAVILSAIELRNFRPSLSSPKSVARINDVGFFCLNSNTWDTTSAASEALIADHEG